MRPLTVDDLLPLDEYSRRRREFFEYHARYVDRYRRVRIGPAVTLIFQNRQTLWFHLQELVRVARLVEENRIQQELDIYNRLLPQKGHLQSALVIDSSMSTDSWSNISGDAIRLCAGDHRLPATLVTCRPEDRCADTTHWLQFHVDQETRDLLSDRRRQSYCEVMHDAYRHVSPTLTEDVRQSLIEDLQLSDKD